MRRLKGISRTNFDDPNNVVEAMAKKLGFDFSSKGAADGHCRKNGNLPPSKLKWAGNLLTRTGTETDYDALRAFDQYIDNISDVIYHTDDIKRLRSYEDYMRYTLSDEGIRARVDAVKNNMDLTAAEKEKRIDEIYEGCRITACRIMWRWSVHRPACRKEAQG